jgi:hypothetical protein
MAGLAVVGWWQARRWSARAKAALKAEAKAKAERAQTAEPTP